jgi:hypothetical protein
MDVTKAIILDESSSDINNLGTILQFLNNILRQLIYFIPFQFFIARESMYFLQTVNRFIGSITFLLTESGIQHNNSPLSRFSSSISELFLPCLKFTFDSISVSSSSVSKIAAKSFHQLCIHGAFSINDEIVNNLIIGVSEYIEKEILIDLIAMQLVSEALTRIIVGSTACTSIQYNFLSKQNLLMRFGESIIGKIVISDSNDRELKKNHFLLSLLCQIIRFSDVSHDAFSNNHIITPLLSIIWPLLIKVANNSNLFKEEIITVIFFDIISKILTANIVGSETAAQLRMN